MIGTTMTAAMANIEAREIIRGLLAVFVDEGESGYGLVERAQEFLAAPAPPEGEAQADRDRRMYEQGRRDAVSDEPEALL